MAYTGFRKQITRSRKEHKMQNLTHAQIAKGIRILRNKIINMGNDLDKAELITRKRLIGKWEHLLDLSNRDYR
jgi:hypothetical protein